jgi:hypothetical protein
MATALLSSRAPARVAFAIGRTERSWRWPRNKSSQREIRKAERFPLASDLGVREGACFQRATNVKSMMDSDESVPRP